MTNYNERLDYILQLVFNYGYNEAVVELDPADIGYDKFKTSASPDKAKQALNSLTKELVAEAKPEKPQGTIRSSDYWEGYYEAKEVFEQNLLKALEEK